MAEPKPSAKSPSLPSRSHPAFWIFPLVAAVALILWDAVQQAQHFRQLSAKYDVAVHAPSIDPASPTGFADQRRHIVFPSRWLDGQHWITHTQQMLADGEPRIREVEHDNAPFGRPVHWASPFRWWLALCAFVEHVIVGQPIASAAETAAFFANPTLLVLLLLTLVPWVARRFGALGAALLALGLASSAPSRVLFAPDNPDHHGLIQICVMATLFFVIAGGGGWRRRDDGVRTLELSWLPTSKQARRAFTFSAVAGGVGLWVSAVSMIPVFVGIALGAIVCAWFGRKAPTVAVFSPELWRRWGAVGAVVALCCYLIEYFPSHLGWRLEVNHPLYALAWLGAGELLAQITARLSKHASAKPVSPLLLPAAIAALISPALAIAFGGSRVFAVSDPFLWSLSHDYTPEFQSLLEALRLTGWNAHTIAALLPMVLVPFAAALLFSQQAHRLGAALVMLPLTAAALFWSMAFKELRWWTVGYSFLFGLVALAPALLVANLSKRRDRIIAALIGAAAFMPGLVLTVQTTARGPALDRDAILSLAERDLAHSLRNRVGTSPLVVLSGPATTSRMIYFANAGGLGTAYWENLDGLKRAAAIFAARDANEAHRQVREAGITHLVLVSWDDFVEPYVRLARQIPRDEPLHESSFGLDLIRNAAVPPWLHRLPDHLPSHPSLANENVLIFEVTDRTKPEHVLVRSVRDHLYRGQLRDAQATVPALRDFPDNLAANVALARVELSAQNRPGLEAALTNVNRLLQHRHELGPEDRMDLIGLLALTGRAPDAKALLEEALPAFDQPSLRRLTPGSLTLLLRLTRSFSIRWPDTRLRDLAAELLPPDGRI